MSNLVKISSTTVTQDTTSAVTLLGIDSTYDVYKVVGTNVCPTTDDKDFYFRVCASGTPQTATNYHTATKNLRTDTTFSNSSIDASAQFNFFSAVGSNGGETSDFVLYLFGFADSSSNSFCTIESVQSVYDLALFGMQGGGVYKVDEAHNGVNFTWESSDTFNSGTITLYGLKK
jgi:hypothetical protein